MRLQSIHLSFGHRTQSLDDTELRFQTRRVVQESHHNLDHLRNGLLELTMLLREEENLFIQ